MEERNMSADERTPGERPGCAVDRCARQYDRGIESGKLGDRWNPPRGERGQHASAVVDPSREDSLVDVRINQCLADLPSAEDGRDQPVGHARFVKRPL